MSTLQHKQGKIQTEHFKVLWGRGVEGPTAESRHMRPRAEGQEKQIPEKYM